jgi:hypothetical protein
MFADERMKEVNHAYEVLLPLAGSTQQTESASRSQAPPNADKPISWWRLPETRAGVLAIGTCVVLFVASSSMPQTLSVQVPPPTPAEATPPPPVLAASYVLRGRVIYDCPVRTDPAPDASRVGRVAAGTEVEVLDTQKGWKKVRLDGQVEGWTGPLCWKHRPRRPVDTDNVPEDESAAAAPSDESVGNAPSASDDHKPSAAHESSGNE